MQRAAASSPGSLLSNSANTPSTEPAAKRRRLDASTPSTPGTPTERPFVDRTSISAALKAEAAAQSAARARNARGDGETEWVLDLNLPAHGHEMREPQSEASDDDGDIWSSSNHARGRQTYGSFKRKNKDLSQHQAEEDLSSASGSESSSEDLGTSHRTPVGGRKPRDVDSDEEMRRVKRAIEQKHKGMSKSGRPPHPLPSRTSLSGKAKKDGPNGRREKGGWQGNRKKSRKTI